MSAFFPYDHRGWELTRSLDEYRFNAAAHGCAAYELASLYLALHSLGPG